MADGVIRFARNGADALRSGDSQMLFDSRFKSLKIVRQDSASVNDSGSSGSQLLVQHSLGYYPLYIPFVQTAEGTQEAGYEYGEIQCNTSDIRWEFFGNNRGIQNLYLYTCLLDLEQAYTSDKVIDTLGELGAGGFNRFEVAKEGNDVTSANPADLVASTRYLSHIIHKVIPGFKSGGAGQLITLPHGLPYPPMVYAFAKPAGSVPITGTIGYRKMDHNGEDHSCWVDATNVYLYDGYSYDYSVVVFKDPAKF